MRTARLISALALNPFIIPCQTRFPHARLDHHIRLESQTLELCANGVLCPQRQGQIILSGVIQNAFGHGEARLWPQLVD